jgi:hypothetical protein
MVKHEYLKGACSLLYFLIAMSFLASYSTARLCETIDDCIDVDCPGSIRSCADSQCRNTDCIVPNSDQIVLRENTESFEEAVEPYEEGINLTVKTKNPGGIRQGMLDSLGMGNVMPKIIKTLGIVFVILIGLILMAMIKSEGNTKAATIGLVIIIMSGLIFVILNFNQFAALMSGISTTSTIWERYEPDDFVTRTDPSDYDRFASHDLSEKQKKFISPRILNAKEYSWTAEMHETKILVLELDDRNYLDELNLGRYLESENVLSIMREKILASTFSGNITNYLFDEDRFAFSITTNSGEIDTLARKIISRYPTEPSSSLMFRSDRTPPEIFEIYPEENATVNNDQIAFKAWDNESGLVYEKLRVFYIDGFRGQAEDCKETDSQKNILSCSFVGLNLKEGENLLRIDAFDRDDNKVEQKVSFIYDSMAPVLSMISPKKDGYVNNKTIVFKIIDAVTGVDLLDIEFEDRLLDHEECQNISLGVLCEITDEGLEYGENLVYFSGSDMIGNSDEWEISFVYDDIEPTISVDEDGFEIYDRYGVDSGSVIVNGESFDTGICLESTDRMTCPYEDTIASASARDRAGNVGYY